MRAAEGARFGAVERFCVFVGHPRSGHSALGTLINAHRHAVVSHNLDALAQLRDGVGPRELFRLILERDRSFAGEDRRMGRYSYQVPGQWLGYTDEIRVIGDKRAGATSRHLAEQPRLLRDLPGLLGLPVVVIHHVRNPWDNIASIFLWEHTRRGRDLAQVADAYFARSEAAERGIAEAGSAVRLVRTFQDDLIRDPRGELERVLKALELPGDESFLAASERFVHRDPRPTRREVRWPNGLVESIGERARGCEVLARYLETGSE